MNGGFKGTKLGMRSMTLSNGTIAYEVGFLSEDGVLHATSKHHVPVEADPNIKLKVDELADLLLKKAAAIHYTSPAGGSAAGELATQGESHGGIAEALADSTTSTDEPGGPQG